MGPYDMDDFYIPDEFEENLTPEQYFASIPDDPTLLDKEPTSYDEFTSRCEEDELAWLNRSRYDKGWNGKGPSEDDLPEWLADNTPDFNFDDDDLPF